MSSVGTSSGSDDDNESTETDDAGVKSWNTVDVISFLIRLQPRKLYASGSGFKVMSGTIGTEIEKWFRGKPKPQDLKIEDLKALEIVTTNWELVKDDDEQWYYTLNKKSNQKKSTQMKANKKRKQSETNAATSPLKTPTKQQKKGKNNAI